MTRDKQNRGKQIAAFAAILGAGVCGTYALAASAPVSFNPFAPTRTTTTLSTTTAGEDTVTPTLNPAPPLPVPNPVPGRPPIRDPFRPPSRSPFTP